MPSTVAKYLGELAAVYNRFYHNHSVLSAATSSTRLGRLALSRATAIVIKRGLDLLGIDAPQAM
jgi:arginyl-tRNA synthetase